MALPSKSQVNRAGRAIRYWIRDVQGGQHPDPPFSGRRSPACSSTARLISIPCRRPGWSFARWCARKAARSRCLSGSSERRRSSTSSFGSRRCQASQVFNRAKVTMDPWQVAGMAQRLRDRGVRVEEFTFSSPSVGRLASTLHLLLRDRALALPDDEGPLDELANVRLRETSPGACAWTMLPTARRPGHRPGSCCHRGPQSPPARAMTQPRYVRTALRGTR
jgi:hypothetical protein